MIAINSPSRHYIISKVRLKSANNSSSYKNNEEGRKICRNAISYNNLKGIYIGSNDEATREATRLARD